ncbi:AAA family ATPase [Streptomyces sp. NPDC097640]|uniref:AAA family ATPase n=1 Tax=Streptomyces sp. NPDC097640 TaxID=3157229 RepID=UPI003320FAE6
MVGNGATRLVVLRGNSASGKSSVAAGIRERFGRGLALVAQDHLRRVVLRERDRPGAANIGLIDTVARYALDAGYHVVVEGILYADHFGDMLARLRADHRGRTYGFYLDVPFEETLARHATKPQAREYGEAELRSWYRERDLLPGGVETVIDAADTLAGTVDRIMLETGLNAFFEPDGQSVVERDLEDHDDEPEEKIDRAGEHGEAD